MVLGVGSQWWAPLGRLKNAAIYSNLTVDRLLALGALLSVVVSIGGPWLVRNLHRPPQIFVLLRDFQSNDAAELASRYVRRHGAAWGYWLTLENADLRAADSISGETEIDPDNDDGGNEKPPAGAWWFTSLAVGLALTTMLLLNHLDSTPFRWMREISENSGLVGDLLFGVFGIVGICTVWMAITLIIRWVLVKLQRTVVLPQRINSVETFQRVLDTIVSRVRRRATTLTLGPLSVISVGDAWWKDAVLRSIAEARLVVFMTTARDSVALSWEMEQVRDLFDPHRTLYIKLCENDIHLTDGNGKSIPTTSAEPSEERIEAAVISMLVGGKEKHGAMS